MAKTIKTTNKLYNVSANVCVVGSNGMEMVKFDCGGFATKSVVKIKKLIRCQLANEGFKVIAIDSVVATQIVKTTVYKFDITNEQLIDLLVNNDIAYTVVDDSDTEN